MFNAPHLADGSDSLIDDGQNHDFSCQVRFILPSGRSLLLNICIFGIYKLVLVDLVLLFVTRFM